MMAGSISCPLLGFANIYGWASITRNLVDCAVLSFTTFMMTLGHCILNFHLQGVLYTDTNLSEWPGEVWQILSRVSQSSHSILNSIHALIHMHMTFLFLCYCSKLRGSSSQLSVFVFNVHSSHGNWSLHILKACKKKWFLKPDLIFVLCYVGRKGRNLSVSRFWFTKNLRKETKSSPFHHGMSWEHSLAWWLGPTYKLSNCVPLSFHIMNVCKCVRNLFTQLNYF